MSEPRCYCLEDVELHAYNSNGDPLNQIWVLCVEIRKLQEQVNYLSRNQNLHFPPLIG